MVNTPAILFDIDFTLIDTLFLRRKIGEKVARFLKINPQTERRLSREYAQTLESSVDFNPIDFVDFLARHLHQPAAKAEGLAVFRHSSPLYRAAVYPEVRPTLARLKKQGWRLGIFSEGAKTFQRDKLEFSGLAPYFDPQLIFIFQRKTPFRKCLPKNSLLVEDNPQIAQAISRTRPDVKIYLVKRGKWQEGNPPLASYTLLDSLDELEELNLNR